MLSNAHGFLTMLWAKRFNRFLAQSGNKQETKYKLNLAMLQGELLFIGARHLCNVGLRQSADASLAWLPSSVL